MSKVLIVSLALLSILALLTSCSSQAASPTASSSGYPAPSSSGTSPAGSSGYPAPATPAAAIPTSRQGTAYPAEGSTTSSLKVVAADGSSKPVTLAALNELPQATVGSDSGPKLVDVLQFANIFDFSTVTVTGSSGSKDLTKDQVTDQVILSLANNSVSLVIGGANVLAVQGVTSIKVK